MLKETETEVTIIFLVTFVSLVAFQLWGVPCPSPGYAYDGQSGSGSGTLLLFLAAASTKIYRFHIPASNPVPSLRVGGGDRGAVPPSP